MKEHFDLRAIPNSSTLILIINDTAKWKTKKNNRCYTLRLFSKLISFRYNDAVGVLESSAQILKRKKAC